MYQIDKIQTLRIGVQGENNATNIEIDMSSWANAFPDAQFHVLFKPYNSAYVYPMTSLYDSENQVLTWKIGAVATAVVGVGYTEIRAQDSNGLIKKTRIIPTVVEDSVSGIETDPPEAQEEWVTAVLNAGTDAKNSAAAAMAYSQGKQIKFEIGDDDDPDGMAGHLLFYFKDEDDEDWEDYLDCGPVDVYAMAVATGYTGTKAQWVQSMNDAESNAQKAEKYAVGKVNGTDVGSTDPTYHNNSKYYSEQAAGKASDSEAYGAGTRSGSAVGSTDPAYQNNSKYYKEQAASSATAAAGSASAAAASASDALNHTQSVIETWLGNNIDPDSGYALDRTLTQSQAATPADITGNLKNALILEKNLVDEQLGYDVPYFEIGTIAFGSGSIVYQNYTTGIRTPLGQEIPVKAGDVVGLTDYNGYQFKYAVKKSNNTYDYSAYRQTNAEIINPGLLYVVVQTTDAAVQTSIEPLGNLCRIKRKDSVDLQSSVKALQDRATTDENHVTSVEERLETILKESVGNDYAIMKRGQYSIGGSSIVEQVSTSKIIIKTPMRVTPGDVFGLRDYTTAQYRYAVKRDSDSKNDYSSTELTDDTIVKSAGVLYIEVSKRSGDISDSEMDQYAALVKVQRYSNSQMPDYANRIKDVRQYANILENGKFDDLDFVRGESTNTNPYIYAPGRQYRATLRTPIYAINDYTITASTGYRFSIIKSTDRGATWSSVSWATSGTIAKGTLFSLNLALSSDSASTPAADVPTYVSKFTVVTPTKTAIEEGASVDLSVDDLNAIETHMTHCYASTKADSYVFFTDPHLMGTNGTFDERTFRIYMDKLKAVSDRITADYIVCGGDWLTSGDTVSKASMKLGFVDGQMDKYFGKKFLPIVGNHDFNYLGVDGNGDRLDPADWVSNAAMRNFWFKDMDDCYYSVKTVFSTFYILNTRTDYDGVTDYDKTMLDWLAAQLKQDDPEHATIMLHIYYLNYAQQTLPNRVGCIGKMIAAFNSHGVCTLTAATDGYEKTYDFTGCTGHIDYSIAGHSHADFSATFGGVPIVGVDNFQGDGEPTFDMVFADYTAGKLYCTRIGTGSDRTFDI